MNKRIKKEKFHGIYQKALYYFFLAAVFIMSAKSQEKKSVEQLQKSMSSDITRTVVPDSVLAQRNISLVDILKGQLAGIKMNSADGAPGAAIDFMIRGLNSVRGDNQPLIVMDGVMLNPMNLDVINSWKSLDGLDYQSNQNLLVGLNTENIAYIEVLKDASAIALYGSKGANGVIIIKTKSGSNRAMEIKWNSNVSVSIVSNRLNLLSPNEYLNYRTILGLPLDATLLQPVNWQSDIFRTAISNNHNLSLSGKVRNTSYYVSAFFKDEEGVVTGTNAQNWGFTGNLYQNLSNKVRLETHILFANSNTSMTQSNSYLGAPGLINQLIALPFKGQGENPTSWLNGYDDDANTWRIMPNVNLKIQFAPMFNLQLNAGSDYVSKIRRRWMGPEIDRGLVDKGRSGRADYSVLQYNTDVTFTFDNYFNQLHRVQLNATGGYFGDENVTSSIQSTNFFTYVLRAKGINLGSKIVYPIYMKNNSSTVFATANAQYNFKNLYEIKSGLRSDYLLDFDDQPTYYPFIQGKWSISNEEFFKNLDMDKTFNTFLIKAGYGISGTNLINLYADADKYTLGQGVLWIPFENSLNYRTRLLTQKKEFNLGIETSMLNNRLKIGIDVYKGIVNDAFSAYNFAEPSRIMNPDSTYTSVVPLKHFYQNRMILDKRGLEISASYVLLKQKDFEWNINGNISFDRSEVIDCGSVLNLGYTQNFGFRGASVGVLAGNIEYATAFVNGYSPGVFYGYRTQGVVTPENEAKTSPLKGQHLYAGDIKYVDMDGNGQTDENDKIVIGNPNPYFTFGLNSGFRYQQWSAQVHFDGSIGNEVLNLNKLMTYNVNGLNNISTIAYNNAWNSGDYGEKSAKIGSTSLNEISDRLVEDGSFVRLSSFSVGYDFSVSKIKSLSGLTVNLLASNLFVISSYSGYNPDVNSFSGNWSLKGIDSGAYPIARSFSIGLVAKF